MRILRSGHPANLCERTEVQNLLKPEIIWKVMPSEREERDYRPTLFFTILRHLATVLGVKHLSNTSVLSLYDCCRAVSASPEGSRLMIKEPFKAATVSVRNSNFRTTAENPATATSHQDAMYAPQFKPPKNHNCTHSIDAVATPSLPQPSTGIMKGSWDSQLSSAQDGRVGIIAETQPTFSGKLNTWIYVFWRDVELLPLSKPQPRVQRGPYELWDNYIWKP
ncbi:hypothetical protein B0H14DRAFT_2635486 [Mycena olivaceomarginata]|nr:hypothetical protein B0H14DRAFT_2635486 [Mycena olivaceomarginata]